MKRLYIAAVAGLCAVAPVRAQDGSLAPTSPVVPAPMLQNGSLVAPGGGWGQGGSRMFASNNWSPLRSPVVAGDPLGGYTIPPLSTDACGPTGCAPARGGMGLDRVKAWLCYRPSPSGLPKLQPAPYVTPLQGMFGCTSAAGCATGYATGNGAHPQQHPGGYPLPLPQTMPMNPPIPPAAGAVMMPPRGVQGMALQPTWQGRVTPMQPDAAVAGYRLPAPENKAAQKPTQGPIVNTGGFTRPGQK